MVMRKDPPYTITLKAADYLAKIVEVVTRLELGTDFKRNIRLHRQNRVRSIYSSLAIEGNMLTLGEVTAVIEGKLVAGGQEEVKVVKNAFAAYDKIMALDLSSQTIPVGLLSSHYRPSLIRLSRRRSTKMSIKIGTK